MIFTRLPSYARLSLCLLLSAAMHGGLLSYGWLSAPAPPQLARSPVTVSLLPATELLPVSTPAAPVPQPETPPRTEPRVQAAPPRHAAPKSAAPAETAAPAPLSPLVADKKHKEPLAEEAIGTAPQVVACDDQPVQGTPVAMPVGEAAAPASIVDAYGQELIEAVPNYRRNPLPEYPYLARQKRWQGVVWLLVDVSADGLVDDLRVEQSCGYNVLDRAASRTVRRWRFTPAMRGGEPVACQVRIPVRFRLEEG